jgi:hypothetical protein
MSRLPPGWPFVLIAAGAGLAALVAFLLQLGTPFNRGCVPADFPAYPGLKVDEEYQTPGRTVDQCNVVWKADADGSSVQDFYNRQLQSGDWELVQGGTNPLLFRRRSRPEVVGSLAISGDHPSTVLFYLRVPH